MNLFIYLPLNLQSKPNEFAFTCRDFQLRQTVCGGGEGAAKTGVYFLVNSIEWNLSEKTFCQLLCGLSNN